MLDQKRDEVAICTILGDGDTRWLASFGQGTRPDDSKRLLHLCQRERRAIPAESGRHIGCRLLAVLRMECRVLSSSLEEVHKRSIQVAKFLLQGNARDLVEPAILRLLLELRQASTALVIGEPFVSLLIDDLIMSPPEPRGIKLHGHAEIVERDGRFGHDMYLVITPTVTWSWGIEATHMKNGRYVPKKILWQ